MIKKYSPAEPVKTLFDNYYFPASSTSTNEQYYNDADWSRDLGFTKDDVSRVIVAGDIFTPPFIYYQAAEGKFDKETIDNAVKTGSLGKEMEVISYHSQKYYYAGADNAIDLTIKNNVRPLCQSYRMAVLDDLILWSSSTDRMETMIDASKNRDDSLADNKNYQALSKNLDDLNAFYAFFSSESYSLSHIKELYQIYKAENPSSDTTLYEKRLEALSNAVLLKPFEALASGVGLDENGYYLVIALANKDAETAEQNASLLEQRLNQANDLPFGQSTWSTFMNGKREISYHGKITTAKLYGEAWKLWRYSSPFQTPMWGFVTDAFIVTE